MRVELAMLILEDYLTSQLANEVSGWSGQYIDGCE